MRQFNKLRFWFAPFLEIKIGPVIYRLDSNIFPPFSCEKDKWEISMVFPD